MQVKRPDESFTGLGRQCCEFVCYFKQILLFRLVSCSSSLLFTNIVFFSVFTPLNPEFPPNDKVVYVQFVRHREHAASFIITIHLIYCREITFVYSRNHTNRCIHCVAKCTFLEAGTGDALCRTSTM